MARRRSAAMCGRPCYEPDETSNVPMKVCTPPMWEVLLVPVWSKKWHGGLKIRIFDKLRISSHNLPTILVSSFEQQVNRKNIAVLTILWRCNASTTRPVLLIEVITPDIYATNTIAIFTVIYLSFISPMHSSALNFDFQYCLNLQHNDQCS